MKTALTAFSVRPLMGMILALAWITAVESGVHASETAHPLARYVAVVFNANEPGSADLARLYAKGRGIPEQNVIGIRCDRGETVSRDHFDFRIKWPIREELQKRKLYQFQLNTIESGMNRESIRYLVLIRGIPLRIAPVSSNEPLPDFIRDAANPGQTPPPELGRNDAAVDSELCLLPVMQHPLSGPLPNFFFGSPKPYAGDDRMILVTRLDGPTYQDVERMIKDTLAAERRGGLKGRAYIDMRGIHEGPYAIGDRWLKVAADELRKAKIPVVIDDKEALFDAKMNMKDAAIYLGWYAPHLIGPMKQENFRFALGAIAYHIHSFSANTLRNSESSWCGPFISRGAVATMGAVNEPYLYFTPDVGIFINRLLAGWNFADSAYASQRMLSWQITMVGDPLYRPFPKPPKK
ncbi:TIGR03790 family protein [Kamptonema cortianum]|nr:TIGR03790 family protein [Oscillatoria laete-virens]MDK3160207.1 TIGR03790 family protein [Kamptonema cortianum]MDL5055649.1 TIGR03790 family protein [Oscillatoria laete-virens NRMC-F 0139]